ncbi:Glyoxalase-like domain protein [compost metagenome]
MQLAKQQLDVGLFTTSDLAKQLSFWQDKVGLAFDQVLKLGEGMHQHRFHANGSIVKVNHSLRALPYTTPSRLTGVTLVVPELTERIQCDDPDGNWLVLVPPGYEGISGLAVELEVSDLDAAARFWGQALQCPSPSPNKFLVGDSLVILRLGSRAAEPLKTWIGPGWRYLTIQVQDCRKEHQLALERGAIEAAPPRDYGGVAVVSFVRDADGNFVELSERTSLKKPQ